LVFEDLLCAAFSQTISDCMPPATSAIYVNSLAFKIDIFNRGYIIFVTLCKMPTRDIFFIWYRLFNFFSNANFL